MDVYRQKFNQINVIFLCKFVYASNESKHTYGRSINMIFVEAYRMHTDQKHVQF